MAKQEIKPLAFVKLHLAGVLIICLIRPDLPASENADATDALEAAVQLWPLVAGRDALSLHTEGWGGYPKSLFGLSTTLVGAIAFVEAAHWRMEQGEYEEGFFLMTQGAVLNDAFSATIHRPTFLEGNYEELYKALQEQDPELSKGWVLLFAGLQLYLPSSRGELYIQDAVAVFSTVKSHRWDIKDWPRVKKCCEALATLTDSAVNKVMDLDDDISHSSEAYWQHAAIYAQTRIDLSDDVYRRESLERAQAQDRLIRDFFDDYWNELEAETKRYLVYMEINWARKDFRSMLEDLRFALECELPAIFPLLKTALTEHKSRSSLLIRCMGETLASTNMNMVEGKIRRLSQREQREYSNLRELPELLHKLADVRNRFVHPGALHPSNKDDEDAVSIRKGWLGIGDKRVLPLLAKMKKATRS